jgi:hypothetical protein
MKIHLPTSGTLIVPMDPTADAPSDCSTAFSLLSLVAVYLASTQCLLKVLKLTEPMVDIVEILQRSPELAVSGAKFLRVAEALTPCALVSTGFAILPFLRDLECVILRALNCTIGKLKSIVAVMTGLANQLNAAQAARNTDLVRELQAAQTRAQASAAALFVSLEAIQAVLELAGDFFGLAGLQAVQLPPAPAATDLNSLNQLLGSLENFAAALKVASDNLGGCSEG